jgi:hypothetical protein
VWGRVSQGWRAANILFRSSWRCPRRVRFAVAHNRHVGSRNVTYFETRNLVLSRIKVSDTFMASTRRKRYCWANCLGIECRCVGDLCFQSELELSQKHLACFLSWASKNLFSCHEIFSRGHVGQCREDSQCGNLIWTLCARAYACARVCVCRRSTGRMGVLAKHLVFGKQSRRNLKWWDGKKRSMKKGRHRMYMQTTTSTKARRPTIHPRAGYVRHGQLVCLHCEGRSSIAVADCSDYFQSLQA